LKAYICYQFNEFLDVSDKPEDQRRLRRLEKKSAADMSDGREVCGRDV